MASPDMEVAPIPEEQQQLTDAMKGNYHLFATGDERIHTAALTATKSLFDSGSSTVRGEVFMSLHAS